MPTDRCKLVFLGSSTCSYRAGQKGGLEHVMIFELWILLVGGTYEALPIYVAVPYPEPPKYIGYC